MSRKLNPFQIDRRALDQTLARIDARRVVRVKATMKAAGKLKAKRAGERRMAKAATLRRKENYSVRRLTLPGWQMLAARMQPDTWYLWRDLLAMMPEYSRGSVKAWVYQRLPREGVLVRAGNPDHDPERIRETGGAFLYAIDARAASVTAEWRSAIGGHTDTPKRVTAL